MGTNYRERLQNMKKRRLGMEHEILNSYETAKLIIESEKYETRGKTDAQKYALGAMQEVSPRSTEISFEEGNRVIRQLETSFGEYRATFQYQGSVPLNIHIRGSSDVDLLVLDARFVTSDPLGVKAYSYTNLGESALNGLIKLRSQCESILKEKYPRAKVDTTGNKSITLSGGSFSRKVDVVPAHWHDTVEYQRSGERCYREVKILDKSVPTSVSNRPFLHMKCIEDKDRATFGGAKKAIRLLKNVRKDANIKIDLSSYEIASLVWHIQDRFLQRHTEEEMGIVGICSVFLTEISANRSITLDLHTPDRSRLILDKVEKFEALKKLKDEVSQLAETIAKEINPYQIMNSDSIRRLLEGVRIAG